MKVFNTTGLCIPEEHYMVDISGRVAEIRKMIDKGQYFTINRARQYGKTTTLSLLRRALEPDYVVISLDFQEISGAAYATEGDFIQALAELLLEDMSNALITQHRITHLTKIGRVLIAQYDACKRNATLSRLEKLTRTSSAKMGTLFSILSDCCKISRKPIVMLIDEVDTASNNQVFLDFLAQLRSSYLDRQNTPTFHSVIMAGVTDIKNLRRKIRPEEAHRFNSPWNIAADFNVDMGFNAADIAGMLLAYEADHHMGMDVAAVAQAIEDYTSGYPYLVSRICQLLDEDGILKWDARGVGEIVGRITTGRNLLFDSLMGKVYENDRLRNILWRVLFSGDAITYNAYDIGISDAEMFGFIVRDKGNKVKVSNRIFEIVLYNFFLSQEELDSPTFKVGAGERNLFIRNGRLDMELVLERYVSAYQELYQYENKTFDEAEGRLRFLLFVRPIINGTGNYYIETQTLDGRRMDVVIDYLGERFVVELKIWRGNAYHERGEDQLIGYLNDFKLKKGYMLSYNFNQSKETGVRHIFLDGRELVEAVV